MQVIHPSRETQQMELHFDTPAAYELVISLVAAAHPARYELPVSWAGRVRRNLPRAIRTDLGYFFGDPISLGAGAIQLIPGLPGGSAEDLLRALESLEAADVVAAVLSRGATSQALRPALRRTARGRGASDADEALIAAHVAGLRAETRKRFREILANPADARTRLSALLQAHAEGAFASRYAEIAPLLAQRAKQGRRCIGKMPAKEVIARVTSGFTLQAPAARSVTLIPSYYAAPFVFHISEGRDVVLVYGARPAEETESAAVNVQTVRVLKALADETRLRILQVLAQRPLYGQQLAEILGVSHPTISHHMAQLRIAGLTRTELAEDGNKTYFVQPETVEALCTELRSAFIGVPQREAV